MQNQDSTAHEMDRVSFTADGIAARRTLMNILAHRTLRCAAEESLCTAEEDALHDT